MNDRERAELELKAYDILATGQRLVVAALRACELLTTCVAGKSPEFWVAVGRIDGAAAICGAPSSVGKAVDKCRPAIGEPDDFVPAVAEALRTMYGANDDLRSIIARVLKSRPQTGQEPTAAAGSPDSPGLKDGKEVPQQH